MATITTESAYILKITKDERDLILKLLDQFNGEEYKKLGFNKKQQIVMCEMYSTIYESKHPKVV